MNDNLSIPVREVFVGKMRNFFLVTAGWLFVTVIVSCSDDLGLETATGGVQNGLLTVNYNLVSALSNATKGVTTNYFPVVYARFTLTDPDGITQTQEWVPGDSTVIRFSSQKIGNHTIGYTEVLSNFVTNNSSAVLYMRPGYNYYVTIDLRGMSITTNEDDMVLIEGGTFTYSQYSTPDIPVTLTYNFYISKYEITFNDWLVFYDGGVTTNLPPDNSWGTDRMPLINVSWFDAINYCNWRSLKEGLQPAYDLNARLIDTNGQVTTNLTAVEGYRLLTDWEWEFVAKERGASSYKFAGSDNLGAVAWWSGNSTGQTHQKGLKAPTLQGVYDLTGNVSEWCYNEPNGFSVCVTNPVGVNSQYELVSSKDLTITGVIVPIEIPVTKSIRGGSYADTSWLDYFYFLNNMVLGDYSTNKSTVRGFRIARTQIIR